MTATASAERGPVDGFDLTDAQQGVVAALQLWPDSTDHVLAECVEFSGPVDPQLLLTAIQYALAQAAASRIYLQHNESRTLQYCAPVAAVPVEIRDLRSVDDAGVQAEQVMESDASAPADPFAGVTSRHIIFRVDANTLWWYHRAHHVALDGYGFGLFFGLVSRCYAQLAAQVPVVGPDSIQAEAIYRELVTELAEYRDDSVVRADDRDYWHELLAEAAVPALPAEPTGSGPDAPRVRATREVAGPLRSPAALPELMILATALHVARVTRTDVVTVGVPMMNRLGTPAAAIASMVLNVVAIPVQIDSRVTVAESMRRIARSLRQARRHGRYRHEDLRRELKRFGGGRALFTPIVNVMPFDYHFDVDGVGVRSWNLRAGPVEDIALQVYSRNGSIRLCLDANPARHHSEQIEAHLDAINTLILGVDAEPEAKLGAIGVITRLIHRPLPASGDSVVDMIANWLRCDPHAIAIRTEGADLSRLELDELVEQMCARLQAVGVVAGDTIVVDPARRAGAPVHVVVAILAALRLGAVYAALDPTGPQSRVAELSAAMTPTAVVDPYDGTVRAGESDSADAMPGARPAGGYLVTTSGSSGAPKAVHVPAVALAAFTADAVGCYGWGPGDVVAQLAPLHADTSIEEIVVGLASGATLALPDATHGRTCMEILQIAANLKVSILDLTTSLWHELVIFCERQAWLPAGIRQIVVGGEEISAELVARWRRFSDVEIVNSYGPSEAAIVNIAGRVEDVDGTIALGWPLGHSGLALRCDATVAEHRWDDTTRAGRGELLIFGPVLARGYVHGGKQLIDKGFADTVIEEIGTVRAFATGDEVEVGASGTILFHGRLDSMVKIGGRRINLMAVQDALCRVDPVVAASVSAAEHLLLAEVVVQPTPEDPGSMADWIRGQVAAELPQSWVPARVDIVDSISRGTNLKARSRGVWEFTDRPLVEVIRKAVQESFGICPADDENIFDLGVTSLAAITLANALSSAAARPVRVDDIFAAGTIAQLATRLVVQTPARGFAVEPELRRARARMAAEPAGSRAGVLRILITGAAGFLGGRLLSDVLGREDVAEVVVIVRAASMHHAVRRLRAAVAVHRGAAGDPVGQAVASSRLIVIVGELGDDVIAQAPPCSHILHCAAKVSAIAAYSHLRRDNVDTTVALSVAARRWRARLILVSTATTLGATESSAEANVLPTGYAQSKWVAERIVADLVHHFYLDAAIIRLGRVVPEQGQPAREEDFLQVLARVARTLGALPDTSLTEPVATVGAVAEVLLATTLAATRSRPQGVPTGRLDDVNLLGTQLSVVDILRVMVGAELPRIALREWHSRLLTQHGLAASDVAAASLWCAIQHDGFAIEWSRQAQAAMPVLTVNQVADCVSPTGSG